MTQRFRRDAERFLRQAKTSASETERAALVTLAEELLALARAREARGPLRPPILMAAPASRSARKGE
jgi:hypothetical protein